MKEKKSKYIPIGEADTPDLWEEEEELPPELESIFDSQNIVLFALTFNTSLWKVVTAFKALFNIG